MFDGPLMLLVNWLVVDTIHLQSNYFASGVKINARGELKLACKDSPDFMNIRLNLERKWGDIQLQINDVRATEVVQLYFE